jgi:hypothetical protein
MHLTNNQITWLLSAHPDTWELGPHPDGRVMMDCFNQGLVRLWAVTGQRWKLTASGGEAVRKLRHDM